MTELSELSDKRLNQELNKLANPIVNRDYLGDWGALMPLVIKNKISLMSVFDEWWPRVGNFTTPAMIHKGKQNPQRALAECLYLVLKEKNNE